MGPVQVLVVGFEHPTFSGEVVAELGRLEKVGIVRLVDVLLVARGMDGAIEALEPPVGTDPGIGRLVAALLAEPGPEPVHVPDGPSWSLAGAMPPGSTAAIALIEHVWAEPLRAAIRRADGMLLEETWLGQDDLEMLERLISER